MDYKERARERYERFCKLNKVDEMAKFKIEQKFLLEEEFKEIDSKETRRRNDVLHMLMSIEKSIKETDYEPSVGDMHTAIFSNNQYVKVNGEVTLYDDDWNLFAKQWMNRVQFCLNNNIPYLTRYWDGRATGVSTALNRLVAFQSMHKEEDLLGLALSSREYKENARNGFDSNSRYLDASKLTQRGSKIDKKFKAVLVDENIDIETFEKMRAMHPDMQFLKVVTVD